MNLKFIFISIIILFCFKVYGQVNWNTISDSVTLTPKIYTINGSIQVNYLGKIISEDNKVQIDFKSKNVYVNNFGNLFRFSFGELQSIFISDGTTQFGGKEFFDPGFKERVEKNYRSKLYKSLDLNEVSFTYSKRNKVEMTEQGKLYIKNEKQLQGKICAIGYDNLVMVNEDGELYNVENGDFNSLKTINILFKDCKSLYDTVFYKFENELKKKVQEWEKTILEKDISALIDQFGPISSVKSINSDFTQYEWSWPEIIYDIDLNTRSKKIGLYSYSKTTNNYTSTFGSLFLYGNSYRSSSSESESSGLTSTVTNTSQSGTVEMTDLGVSIKIIKDKNGKSIKLAHKNLFSDLDYGKPFRFIRY